MNVIRKPPTLAGSVRIIGDVVEILDRRVYPFERRWVRCDLAEKMVADQTAIGGVRSRPTWAVHPVLPRAADGWTSARGRAPGRSG
jgi:methylthioribose-1-phosphate isomerase